VVAVLGVLDREHQAPAACQRHVGVRREPELVDPQVAAALGVHHVEEAAAVVVRGERDREQPALFPVELDEPGDVEERAREDLAVLDHANLAVLLDDHLPPAVAAR
jgi:hypothetical protein